MPAALDIDREQVQMLALTYGVREAARMMGLPESTVQSWSQREGWLADAPRSQPLPPTVLRPATNATAVPVNALIMAMKSDAMEGRAAALKLSRRALVSMDNSCSDTDLRVKETAETVHTWVKSASIAGGYSSADAVVKMNLSITSQPQTMEAQITELPNAEELP